MTGSFHRPGWLVDLVVLTFG